MYEESTHWLRLVATGRTDDGAESTPDGRERLCPGGSYARQRALQERLFLLFPDDMLESLPEKVPTISGTRSLTVASSVGWRKHTA